MQQRNLLFSAAALGAICSSVFITQLIAFFGIRSWKIKEWWKKNSFQFQDGFYHLWGCIRHFQSPDATCRSHWLRADVFAPDGPWLCASASVHHDQPNDAGMGSTEHKWDVLAGTFRPIPGNYSFMHFFIYWPIKNSLARCSQCPFRVCSASPRSDGPPFTICKACSLCWHSLPFSWFSVIPQPNIRLLAFNSNLAK